MSFQEEKIKKRFLKATFTEENLYNAPSWYDIDYHNYQDEKNFYRMLTTLYVSRDSSYLEIGAGTGRLLLPLLASGIRCHAVEPASEMLEQLEKKSKNLAFPEDYLSLECAKADNFTAFSGEHYSLITFPFNGILHIYSRNELLKSFRNIASHLQKGDHFALDLMGPAWEEMAAGGREWADFESRIHPTSKKRIWTSDQCIYDQESRQMTQLFRFLEEGKSQGVELKITQFMWTYPEILQALEDTGFEIEMIFGDVDFSPWLEGSPRLMVCARKK